jgi:hypothetical protein
MNMRSLPQLRIAAISALLTLPGVPAGATDYSYCGHGTGGFDSHYGGRVLHRLVYRDDNGLYGERHQHVYDHQEYNRTSRKWVTFETIVSSCPDEH